VKLTLLDADALHDATYGIRLLARSPAFTLVALFVLATGIGATTALVGLTDRLLFRRLPLPDADRLVTLWERNRATGVGREDVAPGNALDWISRPSSFASAAAIEPWSLDFTAPGGEPEVFHAARVTDRFFDVLGVKMLHGRTFLPSEFTRGNDRVAVLSYGLWKERFASDAALIGRAIRLDQQPYTVVGIMPPGIELRLFEQRREPRVYLTKYIEEFEPRIRATGYWNVVARLKPDVSLSEARSELDTVSIQLAREYRQSNANIVAEILPLRDHLAGSLRSVLPLFVGAAALVLLVSCANAANLMLARGAVRGREFALRQALGAGRGRLVRQMLTESLLLAGLAGAAGLLLAHASLGVIASLRPLDVAGADRIAVDLRIGAIAFGLTLMAAVAAGLAPALQLSRPAAARALREANITTTAGLLRTALVVIEVSLALVLAVGAGLLVRSLHEIQRVDPGFARDHVFALQVFAWDRQNTPAKRATFFETVLGRLQSLPGVTAAGAVSAMPFIEANINIRSAIAIAGRPAPAAGDDMLIYTTVVAGDYFRAMNIPLERGRLFDVTDRADRRTVALVTRSAARRFWPASSLTGGTTGNPVGSRATVRFTGKPYEVEIIGVVGDARHEGLDKAARPELFLAHPQVPFGSMTFVVRTEARSPVTMQLLKEQVWTVDPQQAFYRTATVDELIARTLVGRRFTTMLLTGFGVAALLLAAAGLYGVMSFSIGQRSREFGVRIALGARPADIFRMVFREGLCLALAGIVAGVVVALWLTKILRGLLYGISATDPFTFAGVALFVIVVAALSCYLPARRAVGADPLVTLKAD
jgi:putative ABC transport system permease protein